MKMFKYKVYCDNGMDYTIESKFININEDGNLFFSNVMNSGENLEAVAIFKKDHWYRVVSLME